MGILVNKVGQGQVFPQVISFLPCVCHSIALHGAENWTFRAVDKKHLECFKVWCWRRMEKISWTDRVRNEEVLLRVKEQRNIIIIIIIIFYMK
jgi:hypothetical protein